MKNKVENFTCPMCEHQLVQMPGNELHPGDKDFGVSLWCPSNACPSQEVAGHGDNAREAFEVITDKFPR